MSVERLISGLEYGFVDRTTNAEPEFIPQFLTNNPSRNEKVITAIKREMITCDEFWFSVAFVTYDGVNVLLNEFKNLRDRNVKGKILVSQYQNFTQPKALEKLSSFPNIEVRIVTEEQMKMHSKCYIFRRRNSYDLIIGSSNLTNNALCTNGEWNLKVNSSESGEVISDVLKEFEKTFASATKIDDVWIEGYALIYDDFKSYRDAVKERNPNNLPSFTENRIVPNKMQVEALSNLDELRNEGKERALVISATGSGKTYLSAFDAKKYDGKYLYLVHRKPILEKSIKSFCDVIGEDASIEKYDPLRNNLDAKFLFSTIQTISKDDVMKKIPADTFDYILIDEVHHAGASTYQKVINYFKPKFLVGMTATPDRMDDFDIYNLFEYNIAYEIRLKQAMELNLICPFHYFGIADLEIDGRTFDDKTTFRDIEIEQRVDHIIENARFYGYSGKRVKGIVVCSLIKDSHM
jgi:HKD family nuclease